MAQWKKDGLIIDERWNSGGQIPDRFIELLNRPILAYWAVRDGASQQWPPVAHRGPQVMLINGWSGSGGDAFPTYFSEAGLGPLIGTRTWGGLIGISGAPALVDGGDVTVPTFRMYDPKGTGSPKGTASIPTSPWTTIRRSSRRAPIRSSRARSRKSGSDRGVPKPPTQPAYRSERPDQGPLSRGRAHDRSRMPAVAVFSAGSLSRTGPRSPDNISNRLTPSPRTGYRSWSRK